MIESLLIANRGEIARRIIRTAKRLGIRSIAVYSEADAGMPFVTEADEAVCVGPASPAQSYRNAEAILFIGGPKAPVTSGHLIPVDGGLPEAYLR